MSQSRSGRLPSLSLTPQRPHFHVTFHPPEEPVEEHGRHVSKAETASTDGPPAAAETQQPLIDKNSPQPPNTGIFGEANEQHDSGEKTQVVQQQQLASAQQGVESGLLHHVEPTPGEANEEADHGPKPDCEKTPSSSDETDWDAVAVFIAEATVADPTLARHQQVVKQESVPNSRRNQALSLSEEDRFLLCLSLGHSLRQAAAHVGVHHTTMVKRAKRDAEFAQAMALARQQARTDPLLAVRTASQKSWRAAAWLLEYLERRERRGRGLNVEC